MTVKRNPRRVSLSTSAVRARVRKARKMKSEGYTVNKISQELKVVQSAVHRYLAGSVKVAKKNYVNPNKKIIENKAVNKVVVPTKQHNNKQNTKMNLIKSILDSNMCENDKLEITRLALS